ncbi:flippase [candidate division KSB1 bacterium]|nr:flippase [candidate division KSB1 bacterium]RQW11002.1 MAG: flippase [candidate division KSB1 bacterium]
MANQNSYTSTIVTMARGAGIVFFGIFLSRVIGYILRILLKHFLGLEMFGLLWSSFNVIEMVTFFCLLGIPAALSRYIAFYKARNHPRRVGGFIVASFLYLLPIICIVTVLLYWQTDYIATTLFGKPDIKPFLKILNFGIFPLALMYFFGSIFRGFKLMPQMVFTQQLSRNIFMFACLGVFMLLGVGKESAVWAMLLGLVLTALAAILLFFRHVDKKYLVNIDMAGVFVELFSYSWPLVFTTLFWNMSGRIDVFFLTIYESESNVGVYNAILPLAQFVPVVMQSFTSILMPIFSGIFANYEKNALYTMQRAGSKWIIAFTVPIFLLLIVFSDDILLLLLGQDTVIGATPLCIASVGYFINAAFGVFNIILNAAGKTKLTLLDTSVYVAANILLDVLLIPRYGLVGAAVAGALSMLIMNMLAVWQNYRLYHLKPVTGQIMRLVLIGAVAAGASFILKMAIPFHFDLLSIAVGSFLFILLYFIGLKKIRIFDENDLAIIAAVENRIGKKLTLLRRMVE